MFIRTVLSAVLAFIALFASTPAYCEEPKAHNLGRYGAVYPILEPDFLQEIQEKMSKIDYSKLYDPKKMEKKIRYWKPQQLAKKPRAEKPRVRLVDMTWTLDFDIPDGKGGILYPKGYKVNPLDYITYPGILVFIDASDNEQVEWFKKSPYFSDMRVHLILTDNDKDIIDLSNKLKRPVFYAMRGIAERLQIEYVPSVAFQEGKMMRVEEIYIERKKRTSSPQPRR